MPPTPKTKNAPPGGGVKGGTGGPMSEASRVGTSDSVARQWRTSNCGESSAISSRAPSTCRQRCHGPIASHLGSLPQPTAAVASPVDAQGAMAASAVAWLGADLMNAITKGCGGDGARSVE